MKFTCLVIFLFLLATIADSHSRQLKKAKKGYAKKAKKQTGKNFNRVSTYPVCSGIDPTCDTNIETVAEIVAKSEDGMTIVYTNSEYQTLGFLDIKDIMNLTQIDKVELEGEPTSVAVKGGYALVAVNLSEDYINTSGKLVVYDISTRNKIIEFHLGGQPDSVAVSPDGNYVAIAIENERDEDLGHGGLPQLPAGFLVSMNVSSSNPVSWTKEVVNLVDLDGVKEATDPEPEFVAINDDNIAVVTLQENNAIVLVNLETNEVVHSFSAGTVDLDNIDTVEDGFIDVDGTLSNVPREPDGVTWIGTEYFATANEGDWEGGSRGFTIFHKTGVVI